MATAVEDFWTDQGTPPAKQEGEILVCTADRKGVPMRSGTKAPKGVEPPSTGGIRPDTKKMALAGATNSFKVTTHAVSSPGAILRSKRADDWNTGLDSVLAFSVPDESFSNFARSTLAANCNTICTELNRRHGLEDDPFLLRNGTHHSVMGSSDIPGSTPSALSRAWLNIAARSPALRPPQH